MKSMMCIDYKYSRACLGLGKGTAAALRGKVQRMLPRPLLFQVMVMMMVVVMMVVMVVTYPPSAPGLGRRIGRAGQLTLMPAI